MAAKILVFANHKGGVAKTTLTVNVADALARDGYSILFIDLDPQGNATQLIYGYDETPAVTIEQMLAGKESIAAAIVEKTTIPGVALIGATLKLAKLERELQTTPFSSTSLLLQKLHSVKDVFDVVIIDTPPALSFLTANALAAADIVFVPVESGSKLALVGTDDMIEFVNQAKSVNLSSVAPSSQNMMAVKNCAKSLRPLLAITLIPCSTTLYPNQQTSVSRRQLGRPCSSMIVNVLVRGSLSKSRGKSPLSLVLKEVRLPNE